MTLSLLPLRIVVIKTWWVNLRPLNTYLSLKKRTIHQRKYIKV